MVLPQWVAGSSMYSWLLKSCFFISRTWVCKGWIQFHGYFFGHYVKSHFKYDVSLTITMDFFFLIYYLIYNTLGSTSSTLQKFWKFHLCAKSEVTHTHTLVKSINSLTTGFAQSYIHDYYQLVIHSNKMKWRYLSFMWMKITDGKIIQ